MSTATEQMLRDLYGKFSMGDLAGVLAMCTDDIAFVVPGANPLSGTYSKSTFPELIGRVMTISSGSFREEVADIVANDAHGVAILDHCIERDGKVIHYRTDHIWQIRDGKCSGWVERPGDEGAFNRAWS